jgi:hypothetical protein
MAALRELSTPAMLYVLKEMLERPENKAIFEGDPLLQGYQKHLQETYKALLKSRPSADPAPKEDPPQARLRQLDQRHDAINNVVYRLLGIAIQLLSDPKESAFFEQLRKQLYPHQLRVNLFSRSEEVAEALRLQKQLKTSPESQKALDTLELVCGSQRFHVGQLLNELFDVAAQMNDCLREIAGLPPENRAQFDTEARKSFLAWVARFQDAAQLLLRGQGQSLSTLFAPLDEKLREIDLAKAAKANKDAKAAASNTPAPEAHATPANEPLD